VKQTYRGQPKFWEGDDPLYASVQTPLVPRYTPLTMRYSSESELLRAIGHNNHVNEARKL